MPPKSTKTDQKMDPKGTNVEPKGPKMEPKLHQKRLKWSQKRAKVTKMETQGCQKGAKGRPKCIQLFGAENPTCVSSSFEQPWFDHLLWNSNFLIKRCLKLFVCLLCCSCCRAARKRESGAKWLWLKLGATLPLQTG